MKTKISIRTVQLGLRKEESKNRYLKHAITRLYDGSGNVKASEVKELLDKISESQTNIHKLCRVLTEIAKATIPSKTDILVKKSQQLKRQKTIADKKSAALQKKLHEIETEIKKSTN